VKNANEQRDRNVGNADYFTNEMFVSTCPETECLDVCRATNCVHIEIY